MDGDGIHNGAPWQEQTLPSQVVLHCLEDLLSPLVLLHTTAEPQDGGGIANLVFSKINPGKATHGSASLKDHQFCINSASTESAPWSPAHRQAFPLQDHLEIERLHHLHQLWGRQHRPHLREERLPSGLLLHRATPLLAPAQLPILPSYPFHSHASPSRPMAPSQRLLKVFQCFLSTKA